MGDLLLHGGVGISSCQGHGFEQAVGHENPSSSRGVDEVLVDQASQHIVPPDIAEFDRPIRLV